MGHSFCLFYFVLCTIQCVRCSGSSVREVWARPVWVYLEIVPEPWAGLPPVQWLPRRRHVEPFLSQNVPWVLSVGGPEQTPSYVGGEVFTFVLPPQSPFLVQWCKTIEKSFVKTNFVPPIINIREEIFRLESLTSLFRCTMVVSLSIPPVPLSFLSPPSGGDYLNDWGSWQRIRKVYDPRSWPSPRN